MSQATRRWISEKVKSLRDPQILPFHEILDAGMVDRALRGANAQNRAFAAKLEDIVGGFCLGLCKSPYHVNGWACDAAQGQLR